MYDGETLEALGCVEFDVSPAILDVHYDEGTGLAFLSAKGDTSIRVLETANHDPWMYILDPFMSVEPQQGVAFLLKTECDVRYQTSALPFPLFLFVGRPQAPFLHVDRINTHKPYPALQKRRGCAGLEAHPEAH
jgi:hypothetical protein